MATRALRTRRISCTVGLALLAALAAPSVALAHAGGGPVTPGDLWQHWTLDPWLLSSLLLAAYLYARGALRIWRRAGFGRGLPLWRALAYALGLVTLLIALVSPLDALAETLFSAHMVQHLLLILIAPPLLVLGLPLVPLLLALSPGPRQRLLDGWRGARRARRAWGAISHPAVTWTLATVAVWTWHLPTLYDAALAHAGVHVLEHLSFFLSALLFWWALIQPIGRRRLSHGAGVVYVFAAGLQATLLGALITLAPVVWYPDQVAGSTVWGLTPLADQQLAGVTMWIPAGLVYLTSAAILFVVWLRTAEAAAWSPTTTTTAEAAPGLDT